MAEAVKATVQQTTQDQRAKGAFAYILGWVSGLTVLLIAKDDKFLRFHAWQSTIFSAAVWVTAIILFVIVDLFIYALHPVIWLLVLVQWLYVLYGAYQVYIGKDFRIPVFVDYVPKN